MSRSASCLFHFTSSQDRLVGILTKGFYPAYCLEDFSLLLGEEHREPMDIAIPMVCFCDIPLASIAEHLSIYGHYGIGLTKKWGMAAGLSPVLYTHRSSYIVRAIADVERLLTGSLEAVADSLTQRMQEALERLDWMTWFIKPYEGRMWRRDRYIESVRFYDEREWRYVPEVGERWKLMSSIWRTTLSKDQAVKKGTLRKANLQLRRYVLKFEPMDVRYIIVKLDQDIPEVIQGLTRKGSPFTRVDQQWLASRFVSAEQIREDF